MMQAPTPRRMLPPRTYGPDAAVRKRLFCPESMAHPAKANLLLMRDLFLRYTLPGQTIVDLFGGVGSTLLGALLDEPRHVLLVELEPHFARVARRNVEHIRRHMLPGVPLGQMHVLRGDSRRLPFRTARVDVVLTSPPYAGCEAVDVDRANGRRASTGTVRQDAGGATAYAGYGPGPGQIANLPLDDVDVILSSPPYANLASRHRSGEPNQTTAVERFGDKYGHGDPTRHVDGYGHSAGQIGALFYNGVDGVVSSPPHGGPNAALTREQRVERLRVIAAADLAHDEAMAARRDGEDYASACLQVYQEAHRVVRPGGILVLITGNYVRDDAMVDLAEVTIKLAAAAGWMPLERWRHEKSRISFWRQFHHQRAVKRGNEVAVIWWEDVLVFAKGNPAWQFAALPPTRRAPVRLDPSGFGQDKPAQQFALSL